MMEYAATMNAVLSRPEYQGDLVLAYLWNASASVIGLKCIPGRAPHTETELRADAKVVLSRPAYAADANLSSLVS